MHDESVRLAALERYGVLDTPPEREFDELTRLAAQICGTPMAAIAFLDDRRQWCKARVGFEGDHLPGQCSFCSHALSAPDLFVVADASRDERFAQHPLVTGPPHIRCYASAPLRTPEGHVLGTLCVMDGVARELSPAQLDALRVLGLQVMAQLNLRRRAAELAASERMLRAVFDAEPECVKLVAPDGTIRVMNRAGLAMAEADSLAEVLGQPVSRCVVPEHRAAFEAMHAAVLQGETRRLTYQMRGWKGTVRWLETQAAPVHDASGAITDVLQVTRDIGPKLAADDERDTLRRLIERSPDFIALKDLDGRLTFLNRGGRRMIGLRPDEPLDALALEAYTPEEWRPFIRETVLPTARRQGVWEGEMEVRHLRTGERLAVFRTTFVVRDARGEPRHLATFLRDITARTRMEQALRASEAGLAAAQARAHLGSWELDLATGRGSWSAEMSRLHYRDPARPPLSFDEFVEIVHPDDRAGLARVHRAISSLRRPASFEYRTAPELGPIRHLSATLETVRDAAGVVTHIVGTTLDVTERVRNEERLRRLIESNVQGIAFFGANGRIISANDAYLTMLGYTRADLEQGLVDWLAVTPSDQREADERALAELATRGVCTPYEKEYLRKDGTRVTVLVGAAAFADSPEEGVAFVLDLTERKKLEQQFLRAQRLESIGVLAGGIAHDLNNVLAPILLSLDLLAPPAGDADAAEAVETIRTSAQRAADLVRQVLSFARGVEGRRLEVPVCDLVRQIAKFADDTFLKSIAVRTIVPDGLWGVLGDPTQLQQVLMNLCVNARDAMPEAGVLTIRAENRVLDAAAVAGAPGVSPGPFVLLHVEDTGTGMAPDVVDRIFDPFFTTKEVGKGTGLGLSTSLAIVRSHGGFVRVSSEPGKGSRFEVFLPAMPGLAPAAPSATAAELPRGHGELVLVVDDEAAVRRVTQRALETFGYRVLVAQDGAEAVAICAERRGEVDVVLTDMMMPVMDGPATIQALRTLDPRLRIVAASGIASNGHVARVAAFGVRHVLAKPYTTEAMLQVLRQVLAEAA